MKLKLSVRRAKLINAAVIAISLIFVGSIVIPARSRITEERMQAVCMSHIRELGMASMAYAQDYGRAFPPYVNSKESHPGAIADPDSLVSALSPYLKNKDSWFCPSDQLAGQPEEDLVYHKLSSYEFNFKLNGQMGLDGEIKNGVVLFASDDCPIIRDCVIKESGDSVAPGGHQGKINVFWADGHCSTQPI